MGLSGKVSSEQGAIGGGEEAIMVEAYVVEETRAVKEEFSVPKDEFKKLRGLGDYMRK